MAAAQPAPPQSADEVAAIYDLMRAVSVEFDRQLRLIAAAPEPLSQITVEMLVRLLAMVAPAVKARERLALLSPALLMDGIRAWTDQQATEASLSAQDRAARAWASRGSR